MNRRHFLSGLVAIGCQGALLDMKASSYPHLPKGKKLSGEFDENLVVIISDLHTYPDGYQPVRLSRTVSDIVAMKPKPKHVIALGDLAYLQGKALEYAMLKQIVQPLYDAGVELTMGMGNHDRRENFSAAFPHLANKTKVLGRMTFVVETPRADFIILDSLNQGEDNKSFIVEGTLDDAQRKWLEERLAKATKPTFVMAHHPINETKLENMLLNSPTCCGYIHGHNHVWQTGWFHKDYTDRLLIRTLCVPSTGHWGDIGYTKFTLKEDQAIAELHEYEYFFPRPIEEGEEKPLQWLMIEEEHKDAFCKFEYRK